MKRCILFLEHSTDGTIGGSHLCLLEICRHLDKERFRAVVCFFEQNSLLNEFKKAGADVHVLSMPETWLAPDYLPGPVARIVGFGVNLVRSLIVRTWIWRRLIRELDVDIVHINNACGYDHDLMLACRVTKTPCVVHERGMQASIDLRTKYFASRVNRIIAISDAVAQNLTSHGIKSGNIVRIDDGIDASRFSQHEDERSVRKRLGIHKNEPVIGIVGNIKQWKGQHVVVAAVGNLVAAYPGIRCLFVGSVADHAYYHGLLKLGRELGLPDTSLIFTGYEEHPPDLMRVMDVVVHASVEPEPFGIVLLEAMGAARPLVATNIGGPKEIVVSGETGILVGPGDVDALSNALHRILKDADMAHVMGQRARDRFYEHYQLQDNLKYLEHLYLDLLDEAI